MFFNDDICWCANSSVDCNDYCNKIECFRHFHNRIHQPAPDIFTTAYLKDTEVCPYLGEKDVFNEL